MRKIITILLVSIVFLNCSNDDTTNQNVKKGDPLTGKWVLNRIEIKDKSIQLNDCDLKNTYVFEEENATQFLSEMVDQKCTQTRFEGTWLVGGNGFIIVKFNIPRDSAFIVMNDDQTEIDELFIDTLPDGSKVDRLHVYVKQ